MTYSCAICTKEFKRTGRRKAKCCSLACKAKYNSVIQTGKKQKRMGVYKNCEVCGKEKYVYPHKVSASGRMYCSLECRNKDSSFMLRGADHPAWKGGRFLLSGYVYIKTHDHPNRNSGNYMAEHRLVMEKHLGRYLTANEEVHHVNGIKTDNRLENLELVVKKVHFGRVTCPHCNQEFKIK